MAQAVKAAAPDTAHASSFPEWKKIVSDSFVPLEASPVHPGDTVFSGRLTGRRLRELAIVQVDAMAHCVERTPELINGADGGFYKLSLQLSGRGILLQDGREAVLEPGDLAIYDTGTPYTLSFDKQFTTLVLMFPKQLLGLAPEDMAEMTAVRLGRGHRLGRAVVPFLTQIGRMLPELDGPIGHRLAMNTVDLLSTLLADEAHALPDTEAGGQERLLRRVQHFIDGQLANPDLSPGYIAAAHFMSVRSLHKLFEDSGTTAAAWIRARRLDGARRDLADPLQAGVPVGAIGARWGLPDPAHFSRVFRAAYGQSPSAYRSGR
ncbi:helix-turn-helix domain-containing protein [Arthrobacter sp. zg-Y916]|uniref:AraC-like ligand-binding domain-containing protein n=1 Tax=Arthrobacter sp. zg-Y916 TaxID=2894190 RepID=UPI001E37FB91|nr:helix-turn-helix domain-containing protein [Arthrobacter sp. zg-Y916]MCC9194692.1 helix-turn-helix domain-containing protein [Arthrobacter sp. zg-Y916]